ncbi:MAG: type II toxin-antitoxin system YafQ family toxin [Thermodesulfobacteriota bacterium]|nr:type II toxin-antitoxin system YafQ family toxin [Thermodesulfobacteriota bacterium]
MELFRAKTFKKDYQKLKISDKQYTKYIKYLSFLLEGKALPLVARDHSLIGNYSGFREFHIGGDLLVVYYIEDDIVRLTRIGTHSQIFK